MTAPEPLSAEERAVYQNPARWGEIHRRWEATVQAVEAELALSRSLQRSRAEEVDVERIRAERAEAERDALAEQTARFVNALTWIATATIGAKASAAILQRHALAALRGEEPTDA